LKSAVAAAAPFGADRRPWTPMRSLIFALRPLLSDFLSTLVFVLSHAVFKLDVRVAVALATLIGVVQVVVQLARKRPVQALQWMSLALVVVFGAASFLTGDPRFVMAKPSLIYLAIGAVMLKRGWMVRYLPPIAHGYGDAAMTAFGYVWAGLMFLTAIGNAVVVIAFTKAWPVFIAVIPLASKLMLFAVQFVTVRVVVRRKMRAGRLGGETVGA
jgi:intracellular septation protein